MPTKSIPPAEAREHIRAWSNAVAKYDRFTADLDHGSRAIHGADASYRALHSRMQETWLALPTWLDAKSFPLSVLRCALKDVDGDGEAQIQAVRNWCPDASDEALCTFLRALATIDDYETSKPDWVREWLKRRYQGLWTGGPYLTDDEVDQALKRSLDMGEWDGGATVWPPVLVDIHEDANAIAPPWTDLRIPTHTDYARYAPLEPPFHTLGSVPRHPAMVVHVHGATDADILAAVKENLKHLRPYVSTPIGTRPRGKPKDYADDVELYNTYVSWTRQHGGGQPAFVAAHKHPNPATSWHVSIWPGSASDSGITKRLKAARKWLDPDPAVPETVDAYLAQLKQMVQARAKGRGFVYGIPPIGA